MGNLQKRKKKSLTPINDGYISSIDSGRDKWQWYPKESAMSNRDRGIPETLKYTQQSQHKG